MAMVEESTNAGLNLKLGRLEVARQFLSQRPKDSDRANVG